MNKTLLALGVSALVLSASSIVNAQTNTTPTQMIDVFEKLSGKQPGMRKAHAKGVCATAEFTPNEALKSLSNSALFDQQNIPATVRFSLGGGNPEADERVPGVRGMAVQLNLENGFKHVFVGNNTPVFAAKDPDVFFGLLNTLVPNEAGVVDFAKVGKYIAENPSTQGAAQWQATTKAPYSFSTSEFFGLHTFYFEDAEKNLTMFRWHTVPDQGIRALTDEEMANHSPTFLAERLAKEVSEGKVSYTVNVAIGQEGDSVNDPSKSWPKDRETMPMGQLVLTSVGGEACTPINFDPNVIASGFKTSDDPVLKMRSPAYAISFGKRLSGQ